MDVPKIDINKFDNEISILYKWSRLLNIPIDLLVEVEEIQNGDVKNFYVRATEAVSNLMNNDESIEEIAENLSDIDLISIGIIYSIFALNDIENKKDIKLKDERSNVDNLLNTLNNFYEDNDIDEYYTDLNELRQAIQEWSESVQNRYREDMINLEYLENYQNQLVNIHPLYRSPINIDRVEVLAHPMLISNKNDKNDKNDKKNKDEGNEKVPTVDDGFDIFDDSLASKYVPYIQYNINDNKLTKVYKGKSIDTRPDYSVIIPSKIRSNRNNSIYFTVWSGEGDFSKAPKKSYKHGKYYLENNNLIIRSPVTETYDEKLILNRIQNAFPLSITNFSSLSVGGNFQIYDLEIKDYVLVDMIMNDGLLSTYLFIDEVSNSYAEKSRLRIRYRSIISGFDEPEEEVIGSYIVNPSSVDVIVQQKYAEGGEIIKIQFDDDIQNFTLKTGQPYINVKIGRANSRKVLMQFVEIFQRLMNYYRNNSQNIENLYKQFIPDIDSSSILKSTKISPSAKRGKSANELLHSQAPEIFVKGYARLCQKESQPLIIPPENVTSWTSQTFEDKGQIRNRQVMPFPPDNPRYIFGCPGNKYPYPGVKMNKTLDNNEIYPCIPCCYGTNQMAPTANSNYNKCFRNIDKYKSGTKDKHRIKKENKLLAPYRIGDVSKNIQHLVSRYSPSSVSISRLGIQRSPNSLIHCILIALADKNYLNLSTDEEKENYVIQQRIQISNIIRPGLLKQELYDSSDSEIISQLSDVNLFLDPQLYYRALEEFYKINIFTFVPPSKDNPKFGELEIPRFKLFHTRIRRKNLYSVLILKHFGSEADSLEYPQCELIIDNISEKLSTKIFPPNMSNILYSALNYINQINSWNIETQDNINYLVPRLNIFSRINYSSLLQNSPKFQIIDSYGKMRGLIFPSSPSPAKNNSSADITILFPPTQPLNLPISDSPTYPHFSYVVSTFGQPSAITQSNGQVNGLWYPLLDLTPGLYCPIQNTHTFSSLPIGPDNNVFAQGSNVVYRIQHLKRVLEIILQIIIWLFEISKLNLQGKQSTFLNNFIKNNFILGQGSDDSLNIYDISNVGRKLPSASNLQEAISKISQIIPSLFYQNRIFLYSNKFANGIIYYLHKYAKNTDGLNLPIPSSIYKSNITSQDFKQQKNVAIFVSDSDLQSWINSIGKLSFLNLSIQKELSITNSIKKEPYLYISTDNKIYQIQNVLEGNLYRSLQVAYNWYLYKINMGYNASELTPINNLIPVHVIYGISPALTPVVIENNAPNLNNYLQILDYGSNQYAAMLPLI